MPPASGARKDQGLSLPPPFAMSYLLPYCLWVFHSKQSPFGLGTGSLNLQPCHRAAAHGSGPHGFLDLSAEEPLLRRNPTPGCTPTGHVLQTYLSRNIAPFATIKTNQAPAAQPIHPLQVETELGLSSPWPGQTLHPASIRAGSRWLHRYHHAT